MFNMTVLLSVASLAVAAVALGWLVKVRKHLAELGIRVLESEDIGKIIDAAEKTATYESRMAGCESGTEQSQGKLSEHEKRLGELGARLEATEQTGSRNGSSLAEVSEKMASVEARTGGCESRTEQTENKVSEHETRINDFTARLEAVERKLDEHAASLTEAKESAKVVADEIHGLEEFQAATEKTRSLVLAALNDVQASIPPAEECPETSVDTTEQQETALSSEEREEEEVESPMGSWDT